MRITMYGIRNCDTIKKARLWMDAHDVAYHFHDYKTDGIDRKRLDAWSMALGWESLLNRAGTTFRKLDAADKTDLTEQRAIALMLNQPSMIRRPVVTLGERPCLVGFDADAYRRLLQPRK